MRKLLYILFLLLSVNAYGQQEYYMTGSGKSTSINYWDPATCPAAITLSNTASIPLTASTTTSGRSVICFVGKTIGAGAGLFYAEIKADAIGGGGWSVGIAKSTFSNTTTPGFNGTNSYAYAAGGQIWFNSANLGSQATYTTNDVIDIAFDATNGYLYFGKNGTWQNGGVPTSGTSHTGSINSSALTGTWYIIWGSGTSGTITGTANFGATSFANTQPAGSSAWR